MGGIGGWIEQRSQVIHGIGADPVFHPFGPDQPVGLETLAEELVDRERAELLAAVRNPILHHCGPRILPELPPKRKNGRFQSQIVASRAPVLIVGR